MRYFPAGAEFCHETLSVVATYGSRALMSAYKYVAGRAPRSRFKDIVQVLSGLDLIVDSGMFAVQSQVWSGEGNLHRVVNSPDNQYKTSQWMREYRDTYCDMLVEAKYAGLVIEIDCHHLTRTWERDLQEARKVLAKQFGDRVIYVWHSSADGPLATYAPLFNRIAISDPAMKRANGDMLVHVKRAQFKPTQHVHLLGAFKPEYFALPNNFTCDSTTWSKIAQYGRAFPRTHFPIEWYRRKTLRAPKNILDAVDAKFDALVDADLNSPLNPKRRTDKDYLRALAAAFLAGEAYARALTMRYGDPKWLTAESATKQPENPSARKRSRAKTSVRKV